MTLDTSQHHLGEQHVQRRLLEIHAGLPAADLAELPLALSMRMGAQVALKNQERCYQWLFVAMKQRTVYGRVSGPRLRALFKAFRDERLADPSTQAFYAALFQRLTPYRESFHSTAFNPDLRQDIQQAVDDLQRFDNEYFTAAMLERLICLTKIYTLTEYLLQHGTLEHVRNAEQMLAYGQFDIDLTPLFDDIAWLATRMRTADTFGKLSPNMLATIRGWNARKRHFALDLTWQA